MVVWTRHDPKTVQHVDDNVMKSTLDSLDCRSVCSDILHKNKNTWNFCTKQVSATVMFHPATNSYYHMHAHTHECAQVKWCILSILFLIAILREPLQLTLAITNNSNIFTVVTVMKPDTSMAAVNKPWLWPTACHIIQPDALRRRSRAKERTVTVTHTHKSHLSTSNSGIRRAPTIITDCPPFAVVVNLQPTSKLSAPCIHQPQGTIGQGCMHKWGSTRWVTTQSQLHAWTVSKWSGLNWGQLKMTVTTQ